MAQPITDKQANNMTNKDDLETAAERDLNQRTTKRPLLQLMFVFVQLYLQKLSVVGVEKSFMNLDATFNTSCGMLLTKCSEDCFDLHHNSTTEDTEDIISNRIQWNNACEQQWENSQIFVFVGSIFGYIFISIIGDKFGRIRALQTSCAVEITFAFAIVLQSYWYWWYWWSLALFRFFTAIAVYGMKPIAITYLMEITAVKFRLIVLALYQLPFNLDDLIITGFDSDGPKQLCLVLTMFVPPIIYLLASICLVPESPQWLTAACRSRNPLLTEAPVSTSCVHSQNSETELVEVGSNVNDAVEQPITEPAAINSVCKLYKTSKVNFWDVHHFPHLIKKVLQFYLVCIVCLFAFFVIPHYIHYDDHYDDDAKFLDNLLVSSCQLIGCVICCGVCYMRDIDRKKVLLCGNVSAGISILFIILFIILFKDSQTLWVTVFSCIAFICTNISNLILHLYAFEFLPTVIRCTGIGIMRMISVSISTLSPLLIKYASTYNVIPPAILCVALFIVCVLIHFKMPETKSIGCLVMLEDGNVFCENQATAQSKKKINK